MVAGEPRPDDEPVRMTVAERTLWASLVAVVASSGAYFAFLAPRLLSQPVAEISWVGPMLWTMGLAVAGSVLLTIVFTIAAVGRGSGCSPAGGEVSSDIRDREIGRLGERTSTIVISIGFGGTLVLAMLDVDTFWIGNVLFLFGTVSAIVATTTKLRLYRRGF